MRRAAFVVPVLLVVLLLPVVVALVGAWAQGWTLASVTTGSMRPGTPPGSMVVLAPISPADVAVGDVIGFRDERLDAVVTHRVVAVVDQPSGRFFTTQGDANTRPDGRPVPARAVVGEVRWRIAGLGSAAEAMTDRRVHAAVVGVPLLLLALSELVGLRERRTSRLVAALRAEIDRLRHADLQLDRAPGPGVDPHLTPVPRATSAPVVPRRPTDGTGCLAGIR